MTDRDRCDNHTADGRRCKRLRGHADATQVRMPRNCDFDPPADPPAPPPEDHWRYPGDVGPELLPDDPATPPGEGATAAHNLFQASRGLRPGPIVAPAERPDAAGAGGEAPRSRLAERDEACPKRWEEGPHKWEWGAPGSPMWCWFCEEEWYPPITYFRGLIEQAESALAAERAARVAAESVEAFYERLCQARNIDGPPCQGCSGTGSKVYGSTSTFWGGIGGAAMTASVCDKCWGSGDAERPWLSWKRLRSAEQATERAEARATAAVRVIEAAGLLNLSNGVARETTSAEAPCTTATATRASTTTSAPPARAARREGSDG